MTTTPEKTDLVNVTIDGIQVSVPKNTLVIRAAEQVGVQVPRFCDHPLLEPLGACRQCIVEVEGQRKPLTSCTTTVTDGMVIKTQLTSDVAEKAQRGTLEFLLLNHPLDCPVCDKGGECPLQNQALSNGPAESRFRDEKRTFEKPIAISSQVLLDRERCVLCARCTRFSQQIAGDPFIELLERGALQQVGIAPGEPFSSRTSGVVMRSASVAYWNAQRPLSQFHSSLTSGSAPARRRSTLPRRQSVRCWQPDAQCSHTDGVDTRSNGRARKRYCAPVSAPTGQICTVLPE